MNLTSLTDAISYVILRQESKAFFVWQLLGEGQMLVVKKCNGPKDAHDECPISYKHQYRGQVYLLARVLGIPHPSLKNFIRGRSMIYQRGGCSIGQNMMYRTFTRVHWAYNTTRHTVFAV